MTELSERVAALSADERAALMRRLRPASAARSATIPVRQRALPATFPVSFEQRRLWFLDRFEPGSAQHNIPFALSIEGELDLAALRRTLNELVERHESLRTTFLDEGGIPVQLVGRPYPVALTVIDLSGEDVAERDGMARALLAEEAAVPFDLHVGPLWRASVVQLDSRRHLLAITVHHIVCDGWSSGVLLTDLVNAYRGTIGPGPSVQYADYAVWQRDTVTDDHLAFWTAQLAGAAALDLPTDRPRPPVRRYRGAMVTESIPRELVDILDAFSMAHGVTPFVTLCAALQVLLARYAGQRDFALGTALAGRDRPELEGVVGFLARTVAVRSDVSSAATFAGLLRRVHERLLAVFEHSQMPFERLVDRLDLPRDPSRSPVFGVLLALLNTPAVSVDLPGLRLRTVERDTRAAQFDLSFYLTPTPTGLDCGIEYDTDLFDKSTVDSLAEGYLTVLAAAMAEPDLPLHRLPVLSARQRHRQLLEWNHTDAAYPHTSLGELVVASPAPAVLDPRTGARLSYAELDATANRVANRLLAEGIRPGDLVGVGVRRSHLLPALLLGVLRSGAAYVPVEPDYPADRLSTMADDAGLRLLLAEPATVDKIPGVRALLVDAAADAPATPPPVTVHPEQAAYVIYTSGSTGRPKGVVVSHRALVNLLCAVVRRLDLDERTVLLAVTSLSFDIAGLELFAPLVAGGQVVVCGRETAGAGEALSGVLAAVGPTVMQATPATWRMLLDAGWAGSPGLIALCGGEALPGELATQLAERTAVVWNMYGPTETTVWSGAVRVDGPDVTIGGPLANSRFYLLDTTGQPVPPRVPGELYLAGHGLAHGYVNQPAQTAARFLPDPFAGRPGARMYRTGDQARWRTDGRIEFLGRLDDQVKVRGYRIELGDVEAALSAMPGVAQAVVAVRPGRDEPQLVGYVVGAHGAPPTVAELRNYLTDVLPAYMIPARFAALDALPLTPNGKVDRKALPDPLAAAVDTGVAHREPVGEVELTLASVWSELLGVPRVGRDDNFFAVGGDSLVAVRMVSQAAQQGVSITTKQVFVHQTLAELAAAAGTVTLLAEQGPVTGACPLPIAVHQFYESHNRQADFHSLAFLMQARERLDAELLDGVLVDLVAHHDALRTRLIPGTPARLSIDPCRPGPLLEHVDLSTLSDEDVVVALAEWTARVETGFVAAEGGLFRAVLFDLGPARPQRILLAGHYLVADVVSWHILIGDLDVVYRKRSRGEPYRLPAKSTAVPQWLHRVAEYAASDDVAAEVPLWTDEARDLAVPIAVDHPDGDNRFAANDAAFLVLSVDETAELLERVTKGAKLPLDAVLLAGIADAMTEPGGPGLLPVDIYVPGRDSPFEDVDLSRTVGWLTYRYPMWLRYDRAIDPRARVTAIAAQLRAVPRGGIGYGALRYYREDDGIAATLRGQPVPDVVFNFFGHAPGGFQVFQPLAGTSGHYHDVESERARLVMINGAVFRGQLRLEWEYSAGRHDAESITGFIDRAKRFLLDLTDACPPRARGGN